MAPPADRSQWAVVHYSLLKLLAPGVLHHGRQHCRLTICIELVELTNSETAAATPPRESAKSLRLPSSLENGSC